MAPLASTDQYTHEANTRLQASTASATLFVGHRDRREQRSTTMPEDPAWHDQDWPGRLSNPTQAIVIS